VLEQSSFGISLWKLLESIQKLARTGARFLKKRLGQEKGNRRHDLLELEILLTRQTYIVVDLNEPS
jgi:hypothetical protein